MKMKLKTALMKELVSKAIKGASCNKLMPITSMMAIQLNNGLLTLVTTDQTHYTYIKQENIVGDDLFVVVYAEQFAKLISKLTSEDITFELEGNVLNVKGDGSYRLELPSEEEPGDFEVFFNPLNTIDLKEVEPQEVSLVSLRKVLEVCKPSLAITFEEPCYTSYYVGKQVVATDHLTITFYDKELLPEKTLLIPPEFIDLVNLFSSEKIYAYVTGNNIIFTSPEVDVYGKLSEGLEEFEIDAITPLFDLEMGNKVTIKKSSLLSILDRIELFVGPYENNAVRLTFSNDGLSIQSMQSTGIETISYIGKEIEEEFTCLIDVHSLQKQVKAYAKEDLVLEFGNTSAIKLVDDGITIIVSLLGEDEISE